MTKRSLDFALLGLVAQSPAHGYLLWQRLESALGGVVDMPLSRIYDVLHRLERHDFVAAQPQRVGRRVRRVYSVRPAGRRALRTWASTEPPPLASLSELALRLLAVRHDPHGVESVVRAWKRHEIHLADTVRRNAPGLSSVLDPRTGTLLGVGPAQR